MTVSELTPLVQWLSRVPPSGWAQLQRLHYSEEPLHVAHSPRFTIMPLSSMPTHFKTWEPYPNELTRKRFVDAGYDVDGYRVRFDLVAGYIEPDLPSGKAPTIFAAAKTGSGHFVESIGNVMTHVDSYCIGKWCFYNKAFHFQEEGDALMTNAYVYS